MAASTPGFELNTFDAHWAALDTDAQTELIKKAGFMSPSLGILPVLEGLFSFNFNSRTAAKNALEEITGTLKEGVNSPVDSEEYREGLAETTRVCARLYHLISADMHVADMSLLLNTLLRLGDRGAFFAFKALYQGRLTMDVVSKCIQGLGEYDRLVLVDQYLSASPSIRLKFADLFKALLMKMRSRDAVIDFYASLFDRKRDADPFLNNIPFKLRHPDLIMSTEVASMSPALRVKGLKALAMMRAKIPVDILADTLDDEEVKKVRLAVYSLIENSSLGLYPELFDPIFKHFKKTADATEAVNAFKAMVVTGKIPINEVMSLVRQYNPEVLPNIHIEISELSRLSFFAIQDIALNKDQYLGENYDVNLACVFGMIKKRPERVVKILKAYDDRVDRSLKMDVSAFMEKTIRLLRKERENMEAPFKPIIRLLKTGDKGKKSFLKSMLKSPLEKKLEALRANTPEGTLDFYRDTLADEDFSGLRFNASQMLFTETVFQGCDLSRTRFERPQFRGAVFYNVDMEKAEFRSANFDNAVFINVNAVKTTFHRCSFQGARFFNTSFNRAALNDALFVDAEIAKCAFGHTDLNCAVFSGARISGVSFATAYLNLADFTGVRARFSRFPADARNQIKSEGIDYNAREHQLGFKDLPQIDKNVVSDINMLIFCEFIHYGEAKFLNQNKLSVLTAFDVFKPVQADFFQLLPILIHENLEIPDVEYMAVGTPCGISDYLPTLETLAVAEKYLGKGRVPFRRSVSPYIQGLFSMGSVGSLAQTTESDIDYWVCIDEHIMDREGLGLLRRKLTLLEKLAFDKFKVRVTFFIVDVLKARNNDFGGSSRESSGSAQARLLKEEFYRTMIHVAGKLPLWAVLPTTISINYYNLILERITKEEQSHRYIDLGDIHAIPVNEYFGASIWQMFKWLKSPFKSVIKMALLEKYINAYGRETLLCNQYKNEWMNSGTHLKPGQNDSYIILLNTLIDFYIKVGDERSVNLLLTCFFLKLEISKKAEIDNSVFGLRKILLERSLNEWGWSFKKVFEVGRFKIWPYAAIFRLSTTIERYMVSKFSALRKRFDSATGLMISENDRIVLERKVNTVFQDKKYKIKKLLLVSRGDRHFSRLHLKHIPLPNHPGKWELVHKISKQDQPAEEAIKRADTIEEIGAWMINNRLYTGKTYLGLLPNPTPVSHDDIEKLYRAMYDFLDPEVKKRVQFKTMRRQPTVTCLFVCLNFYAPKPTLKITDYTVVYMNSWGEMYLRTARPAKPLVNLETAKKTIRLGLSLEDFPEKTAFYFSRGMAR
ncbi:MAG: class I adenylate cyclase [Desulfobacterales bacterium]|nr:class I adenylate cyclase [Desulfobacterales bacterium]